MRLSTILATLGAGLDSAHLDGSDNLDSRSLLRQFYAPGRLLGNSFRNPGANEIFDHVVVGVGLAGALTA